VINQVIIVGAFHEIIELAEELNIEIVGLIDFEKKGSYLGYPVLGNDSSVIALLEEINKTPLVITPDLPTIRKKLSKYYKDYGFSFSSLISTDSKISRSAILGKSIVVQSGVNISAQVKIGDFVKLNTNCNIMHDSCIGNFTTIAPNAVILGNVTIGESCYVGSNATVLPNISICNDVIIGAGAVVTKSIFKAGTYIGQPAKLISRFNQ
jgi:UDP-N-acetylbacillosamine N-acetyltransferase